LQRNFLESRLKAELRTQERERMPLFANIQATIVFLLALVVAIVILLRRVQRYRARLPAQDGPIVRVPRPGRLEMNPARGAPPDVAKYEVQLHETARELSAKLDTKMIALEHLIRDADKRIGELKSLLQRTDDEPDEAAPDVASEIRYVDPRYSEVYSLADQGFSAVTIAHRVGSTLVDVETILAARRPY
jgi:hypothetical protein